MHPLQVVPDLPPAGKVVQAVPERPNSWRVARGNAYAAVLIELRARPGEWFRIVTWPDRHRTDRTLVRDIRAGKRGFNPPGSFEAVSGFTRDNQAAVWCRYFPQENPHDAGHQLSFGDETP